jgi:hypothetical protein
MDSRPWHERLQSDLRRQRLPAYYIDRLVEELAEHVTDLQKEKTSMDAHEALHKLGTTEHLAAIARQEFRRRTFAGRHPVLTFVVGPIAFVPGIFLSLLFGPFIVLSTIDILFGFLMGNELFRPVEESSTLCPVWVAKCFHEFFRFVPFAASAFAFGLWGRRCEMHRWAMLACGIVAVMAGILVSQIKPFGEGSAEWIFGVALKLDFSQFLQVLVPLAIGGWLLVGLPQWPLQLRKWLNCTTSATPV